MQSIVCAFSGIGSEFTPAHVARLAAQIRRHTPSASLICLTHAPDEIAGIVDETVLLDSWLLPLWGRWGHWPKLAMFRLPGPCLYLDLDVTVIGDLAPMLDTAARHHVIACRDFWGASPPGCNSSVVGWSGDARYLWSMLATDPETCMHCDGHPKWSDQDHIRRYAHTFAEWQEEMPSSVMSFKRELRSAEHIVAGLRVVVSHGQPRPWVEGGADQWLRERRRWV